jgi:prolyl-tRNA editing enzyme YbaK/EbsC (Cys-tRNA(Pro) deacylase)
MIVSGGRRGLSIEIEPSALCTLLNAKVGDITDKMN